MFSEALREVFPHVGFVSDVGELEFKQNIVEFEGSCSILLPPDAHWWTELDRRPWITSHDMLWACSRPYISVSVHRSWWRWSAGYGNHNWAWDPPTLDRGFISTSYRRDGPAHVRRDIARIWKVAERVTARCLVPAQLPEDPLPPGPVPRALPGTFLHLWAGYGAAAWCRLAPRRMIDGYARPSKYWEQPRSAWYDATARRMEETYGALLADPESEPRLRET